MATTIPEKYLDLLENPVVVGFATVLPDGHPQVTPVWCKWDGENIIINTAVGRRKDQNVRANPKVTVMAVDPQNPYRYLEVRGQVVELRTEGADETINELAKAYVNKDVYYGENGVQPESNREARVDIIIEPLETSSMG